MTLRTLIAALALFLLAPAAAQASVAYHDDNGNPTAEGGPEGDAISARAAEGGVVFTDLAGIGSPPGACCGAAWPPGKRGPARSARCAGDSSVRAGSGRALP